MPTLCWDQKTSSLRDADSVHKAESGVRLVPRESPATTPEALGENLRDSWKQASLLAPGDLVLTQCQNNGAFPLLRE